MAKIERSPKGAWAHTRAGERRVRLLLDRLRRAGAADQQHEGRIAVEELIALYAASLRSHVARELSRCGAPSEEAEHALASAIELVGRSLKDGIDLRHRPLHAVIARCAQAAVGKALRDEAEGEVGSDREALAALRGEPPVRPAPAAAFGGPADALIAALSLLSAREQELVLERVIAGLTPEEVARRRKASRSEVDREYSHALLSLRRRP